MTQSELLERITTERNKCDRKPCIGAFRIRVVDILHL
jgi:uncharacterized protein (DUF433 family)